MEKIKCVHCRMEILGATETVPENLQHVIYKYKIITHDNEAIIKKHFHRKCLISFLHDYEKDKETKRAIMERMFDIPLSGYLMTREEKKEFRTAIRKDEWEHKR